MARSAPSGMVEVQNLQPSIEDSSRINVGRGERLVSAIGGGLLALRGLTKGSLGGLVLTAVGSGLVYRGISGHCALYERLGMDTSTAGETPAPDKVTVTLTIARPREAVYAAWREFENLPRFMRHLVSVSRAGDRRYHWVARAPGGLVNIEWDAQVVEERENELIAWQSLSGAQLSNAGWVSFRDTSEGAQTEMRVELLYRPAAGTLGAASGRWFPLTRQLIEEDVSRFKRYMETGEIPSEQDQPATHM
ncbi:MAG: DUF2892 domain-containing protein [Pseudomonadota bacterium]|nr:DUF2892 domain-containing protein [Pseudomonadota bacterium]